MADRIVYHIVPDIHHVGRHWKLEKPARPGVSDGEGAERHVLKIFITKKDAISYGKELAAKHCPSQLIVHEIDGRFEEEFIY